MSKLYTVCPVDENEYHSYKLLMRLFKTYIKVKGRDILVIGLCMIVVALATATSAWLMKPALDKIFLQKSSKMLLVIPVAILLVTLIKGVASFYQNALMKLVGQHIAMHIQADLYAHIVKSDIDFFREHQSGNLISRFTNEINTLRLSLCGLLENVVCNFVTLAGLVCVMFYQSVSLSIVALIVFPMAFKPVAAIGRRMRKIVKIIQYELGGFATQLDETFQNINIVKSYCREEYEISRASQIMTRLMALYKRYTFVDSAPSPLMETVGGVAVAAVIWYGGYSVIEHRTTPGAFFSFVTALLMLYQPLKSISKFNNLLHIAASISGRIFGILDEKPRISDKETARDINFTNYDIEFKNISFNYVNGLTVLEHLSIKIPEYTTTALVGASGQGKTTIFNLIERFYDVTDGSITLGGHDITDIKISCLRDNIAMVSQDVMLFDDTVMENIRYGKLDATDGDVVEASKAAAAHEFITTFDRQYDTNIGPKGVKLSGGQKQRIAIARAILKNAPILLLDEATSALDSISERKVQNALENLTKGRTTVVIAHRLSTIEKADIIYLISHGKVVEQGTHAELLKAKGAYASFYSEQWMCS